MIPRTLPGRCVQFFEKTICFILNSIDGLQVWRLAKFRNRKWLIGWVILEIELHVK